MQYKIIISIIQNTLLFQILITTHIPSKNNFITTIAATIMPKNKLIFTMMLNKILILILIGCLPVNSKSLYQIDINSNGSFYPFSGKIGKGYELLISRGSYLNNSKISYLVGGKASYYQSQKIYEYQGEYGKPFPGSTIDYGSDSKIIYLGIPASIYYRISTWKISPYLRIGSDLDFKIYSDSNYLKINYCSQSNCIDGTSFHEAAKFEPIVFRLNTTTGVSVKLLEKFILVDIGLRFDILPSRSDEINLPYRTHQTYLAAGIGLRI